MRFNTKFDCIERNKNFVTSSGSDLCYDYKEVHDKSGELIVIKDETSFHSMSKLINAYKDDVDLEKMYSRYLNGDLSALDKNKGWYGDVFEAPKNLSEFLDFYDTQKAYFDKLPVDFKTMFNNDYRQYAKVVKDGNIDSFVNKYKYDYFNDVLKSDLKRSQFSEDEIKAATNFVNPLKNVQEVKKGVEKNEID